MSINDIKIVFRYSKYLLPILMFWSLTRLAIFYSFFNINIGNYISIQEILNPFINDVILYVFTILIPTFLINLFWGQKIAQENLERFKATSEVSFWTRLGMDLKLYWVFWLFPVVLCVISIVQHKPIEQILATFIFIPFLYLILWIRKEALIKADFQFTDENVAFYNFSTVLIFFFLYSISNTFVKIDNIKNKKNEGLAILYLENEKMVCTDSVSYIGKTENFTFIYNRLNKRTTVLQNSIIKKIDIRKQK